MSALARPRRLPDPAPGVRAWTCDLARDADEARALAALLSPSETARMARFGRDDLRLRYAVGRATLRVVLGGLLAIAPQDIEIVRGRRGRPELAPRHGGGLDFNVSHTLSTALFGVTQAGRIGVDIEHVERTLNVDGVARKFMSPREQARLATLDAHARRRELLLLWTCKEAMSKATGDALSAPFRELDVDTRDARTLMHGPAPYLAAQWRLHRVDVGDDYFATAAVWTPAPG